ncbi:uncharacterized protein LOC116251410 isoform X3 [Nymphaea colorata]|uniref:uncharacterized protein LOC116251410 isoform X3 n=1 Tax=Nymphaea colorata TaxID=210225 RepID=UPI00214F3A7F|nr:uncharacterized protein LOC116251410 isoform X3 [Nymphaea colorata]
MTGHGFSYRSQGEPTKRAASVQKIKGISATLRLFLRKFCNFYPVRARSICHDLFHTDLPAFMFGIWMNNAKLANGSLPLTYRRVIHKFQMVSGNSWLC